MSEPKMPVGPECSRVAAWLDVVANRREAPLARHIRITAHGMGATSIPDACRTVARILRGEIDTEGRPLKKSEY